MVNLVLPFLSEYFNNCRLFFGLLELFYEKVFNQSLFEKEKMWIPIKFTIDTPLGALVIKAKEINDNSNEG